MNARPAVLLALRGAGYPDALRAALPGAEILAAPDPAAARALLAAGRRPALALLDADDLGAAEAAALCRELRAAGAADAPRPRIVLRLREPTPEAVRAALRAGADDVRPPEPAPVLAALAAPFLEPAAGAAPPPPPVEPLTPLESHLLAALAAHPGTPLSREWLLESAHGGGANVRADAIDKRISRLRRKLGPEGWRLETVWGSGFRWSAAERPPSAVVRLARRLRRVAPLLVLLAALLAVPAALRARRGDPPSALRARRGDPPSAVAAAADAEPRETPAEPATPPSIATLRSSPRPDFSPRLRPPARL